MLNLVRSYIDNMRMEDLNNLALSKGINLNDSELEFLYNFIKKNYEMVLSNPNLDLSNYKEYFSLENYNKIVNLFNEYKIKYASYLH